MAPLQLPELGHPVHHPNPPSWMPTHTKKRCLQARGLQESLGSGTSSERPSSVLVTRAGSMETGKGAHQSCWDGKRSGKPAIWEESNTAWVVYRLARRRLRILSINTSKANTRRNQSVSIDRKTFVKKKKKKSQLG